MPDEAKTESIRSDFVALYLGDLARGATRSAEGYYQLYPGFEDVIASELARLRDAGADDRARLEATSSIPSPPSEPRAWSLGKYRIERELGRGAQGTVYLARDETLDRLVALKVLKASWTASEAMTRRFELEAQALARMDPRGLAVIHDAGVAHGLSWFAMRYVEGRTLARELTERRSLPGVAEIRRWVVIAEKAARALHRAHESGLLHRDLKPGNLMITPDDEPVILDFGVARFFEADGTRLTLTGDLIGTPAFMAPEQASGDAPADRRTDVYGLAATLHEALTRAPGADPASSPTLSSFTGALGGRPPARRLNPRVSRDLDAVLRAALDPDRDHRYDSAAAFADDLARVLRAEPVVVKPRGQVGTFLLWCRRAPAAAALALFIPAALGSGLVALWVKNREIQRATRELEAKQKDADDAAGAARARFAEFQRLDDLRKIVDVEERERDLWPAMPATIPAMERWLADARELAGRLPEHRAALDALRRRGKIAEPNDPDAVPELALVLQTKKYREAARAEAALPETSETRRSDLVAFEQEADAYLVETGRALAARRVHRFDSVEDQWVHDNLAQLVTRLEKLLDPAERDRSIDAVERRIGIARQVEALSLRSGAAAWADAVRAIANPATDAAYGGLVIEPVLGLVPLGRDPVSKLWEFAVVASGKTPERDASGRLVIGEDSAIVLVLVPGGTVAMGARPPGPDEDDGVDNLDSAARLNEKPVHAVTLDPFFLSKFEMTQGQWLRAMGTNPAHHRPDRVWTRGYAPSLRQPVEQVSFEDCESALRRLGLRLPTEAQWEYAARAGTTTPWWCGSTIATFLENENLADETVIEVEQLSGGYDQGRRDGWTGPAPVGSYPANPWGFHDVIGNVAEICADGCETYGGANLPGDGLHCAEYEELRVVRGGGFNTIAASGRSSYRFGAHRTHRQGTIGVRPALALRAP